MNLKEIIKTFFVTKTDNFSKIESQRIKRRFFEIRKMEYLWDENREILENPIELSKFIGTLDIISFTGAYNYTGLCEKCNSETSFVSIGRGFKKYCSKECLNETKKETNLLRYGGTSPMACEKVKSKVKETNLEKYGAVAPIQNKQIMEKTKKTNLEKYGYENTFQVPEFIEKSARTRFERYGGEYTLQSDILLEKINNTVFEKYGVTSFFNLSKLNLIKEKIKNTNIKKLRWYNYERLCDKTHYDRIVERCQYKFKNKIELLENYNRRGIKSTDYHLDHMFSKHEGLKQGILPYYIGHICNLEMIEGPKNLSKGAKCSITSDDLFNRIEEYNKNLK